MVAQTKTDDRTARASQPGRDASEAARAAAEEAARTARELGSEAAEAGRLVTGAGLELARRSADAAQEAARSGMSMAAQVMERSADQLARAWGLTGGQAEEAAHRSRQNLEAILGSGQIIAKLVQDVSREWMSLAQEQAGKNLNGIDALLRCRTPQDVAEAQSGLMRDNLQFLLDSNRRVAEMSVRITEEASRKIARQADEAERARGIARPH
jgi:hypothetical protein